LSPKALELLCSFKPVPENLPGQKAAGFPSPV